MALTLSEFLLRDFVAEQVGTSLVQLKDDQKLCLPDSSRSYFHLVLAGTPTITVEESGRSIKLGPGNFALLLYGAAHSLGNAGAKRQTTIRTSPRYSTTEALTEPSSSERQSGLRLLSGDFGLVRTPRRAPSNRTVPHLLCSTAEHSPGGPREILLGDITRIERACYGEGAYASICALVQLHLTQELREINEDYEQAFPTRFGARDMGRMGAVVRKIRAHPERPWTVALLAEEVGCSRSSFAAKFKSYAGFGPISFVVETRLKHAASLLRGNSDLPIWDVAQRVGYGTQGSFTRAFRARFGVTPRTYVDRLVKCFGTMTASNGCLDEITAITQHGTHQDGLEAERRAEPER